MTFSRHLVLASVLVASIACQAQDSPTRSLEQITQSRALTRVIVQLRALPGAGQFSAAMASPAAHLAATHSSQIVTGARKIGPPGLATVEITSEGLKALQSDPQVLSVVEDRISRPTLLQTVNMVGADVTTLPNGGLTGGTGQVIAVVDTGVNSLHPFLRGKVIDEACFSTSKVEGHSVQSLCPNGLDTQIMPGAARDCDQSIAGCGHGTHVAGIAVGGPAQHSEKRIRGVAPGARVISIQVYTRFNDSKDCSPLPAPCALSFASDQIRALEYVLRLGDKYSIVAVNMSLGSGSFADSCVTDPLTDVVERLSAKRIATIVSSGNDALLGAVSAPACVPGAIPVGAIDKGSRLAIDFSNTSELIALLAPGDDVVSSAQATGFTSRRGTSMAAPHVSGAWAVLRQTWPKATVSDIRRLLHDAGMSVADPRTGQGLSAIRVNAAYLLAKVAAEAPPSAPVSTSAQPMAPTAPSSSDPKRVIVQLPSSASSPTLSPEEVTSRIKETLGAKATVTVRDRLAIVEHSDGISKHAGERIKAEFGVGTAVSTDRLSRPQAPKQ